MTASISLLTALLVLKCQIYPLLDTERYNDRRLFKMN